MAKRLSNADLLDYVKGVSRDFEYNREHSSTSATFRNSIMPKKMTKEEEVFEVTCFDKTNFD